MFLWTAIGSVPLCILLLGMGLRRRTKKSLAEVYYLSAAAIFAIGLMSAGVVGVWLQIMRQGGL